MKNRCHKYDINRTRPRHGGKCTKYKMCLSKIHERLSKPWDIYNPLYTVENEYCFKRFAS